MSERMWMVRAGEGGRLFDDFDKKKIVAIGFRELGDLTSIPSPSELKKLVKQKFYDQKPGKISIHAGQVIRFRFEFKKGDMILTYNPETREYLVGEITGDYEYKPSISEYPNIRSVKWLDRISRDKLSVSARNTLGAISTIFDVGKDAMNEIQALLKGTVAPITEETEESEEDIIKDETITKSREFIKDKVNHISWEDAQELVAGILRAMGYKTRVSPRGPDMGKDILASKDGLGLEDPRIIVEVKHRSGQMGASEVKSFIGGIRAGSKAVYVSTGGFTKEAKMEAERSNIPLMLVDLEYLTDLIIQNYDNFDSQTKEILPLRKIYWPE